MWMACPDQESTLQGQLGVSSDVPADNESGTGSGWQQNKQDRALPAVVGEQVRMDCRDLWSADLG